MLQISISEVPQYVELARKSKNNILIVGDPGVGKSQVINGMAGDDVKVTSFTGSSTYEETINGIPFRDSEGMDISLQRYTTPRWLRDMLEWSEKHPKGLNIFFIDEFNTAEPQVLKTFLSVLTEHKVPTQDQPLPDNTVIIAAMNPCDQNNGEELIRPLASRFITLEIKATPDSYLDYQRTCFGEKPVATFKPLELLSNPRELEFSQVEAIVGQILKEDWQNFTDGSYHEINPRSLSNFLEAMKWVKDANRECPRLSQAFFGRTYRWTESLATHQAKREEKIKNNTEFLTEEELRKMNTNDLKAYLAQISKPNIKGSEKLMTCRLTCRKILSEREDA